MTSPLKFILGAVFFIMYSCADTATDNKNSTEKAVEQKIEWEILSTGQECNVTLPGQQIIDNQNKFESIWKETHDGNIDSIPRVDFNKNIVVVCYLGIVNSSGHNIKLDSVEVAGEILIINLTHLMPGAGCMTAQVLQTPYLIASINKGKNTKPSFKIMEMRNKCE